MKNKITFPYYEDEYERFINKEIDILTFLHEVLNAPGDIRDGAEGNATLYYPY